MFNPELMKYTFIPIVNLKNMFVPVCVCFVSVSVCVFVHLNVSEELKYEYIVAYVKSNQVRYRSL